MREHVVTVTALSWVAGVERSEVTSEACPQNRCNWGLAKLVTLLLDPSHPLCGHILYRRLPKRGHASAEE